MGEEQKGTFCLKTSGSSPPSFLTIRVAAAKYEAEAKQAQASLSMCFRFSSRPRPPSLPLSLILVRAGKKKWERRGLPRFSFFPLGGVRRDGSFSLSIKAGRKREGGSAQHVAHFPPTNQPFPYQHQQCFCHSPPSLFSLQALEGRGRGRKAKASKSLSSPPPHIPFRYTKSCGAPAKKDGRGEKISRHAKSGRMWRMRDEPRASGGKRGGEDYVRTVMACA